MSGKNDSKEPPAGEADMERAASGVPTAGWALGDRFSWNEIQQRLLASADEEIAMSVREQFFSAVTAGFAIVITLIGLAEGSGRFPDNRFLAAVLYPVGFMYIILGRYQLYTENTLPPVKLVLTRMASIPLLLRLWIVVLIGNTIGAGFGAFVLAKTQVLSPEAMQAGARFAQHGIETAWWDVFYKALFAGWLVAGVVWLNAAARDTVSRVMIIYIIFYMIGAVGLFHVITVAAEVLYFVFLGVPGPGLLLLCRGYWLPTFLGNSAGGVLLFALASYAQGARQRFPEVRELTLRDLFFSWKGGREFETPGPRPRATNKHRQKEP